MFYAKGPPDEKDCYSAQSKINYKMEQISRHTFVELMHSRTEVVGPLMWTVFDNYYRFSI